jgi:hypothetical protein
MTRSRYIESSDGTGSGVLVRELPTQGRAGPGDVYLYTNHHVVGTGDITCRMVSGDLQLESTEATSRHLEIVSDWRQTMVCSESPAPGDPVTHNRLDYVRIPVTLTPDDAHVIGVPLRDDDDLSVPRHSTQCTVLQFPASTGLNPQTAPGEIVHVKRYCVEHSARTEGGSSGGPVFDDTFHLIGLHRAGHTDSNDPGQMVSFATIMDDVRESLNKRIAAAHVSLAQTLPDSSKEDNAKRQVWMLREMAREHGFRFKRPQDRASAAVGQRSARQRADGPRLLFKWEEASVETYMSPAQKAKRQRKSVSLGAQLNVATTQNVQQAEEIKRLKEQLNVAITQNVQQTEEIKRLKEQRRQRTRRRRQSAEKIERHEKMQRQAEEILQKLSLHRSCSRFSKS